MINWERVALDLEREIVRLTKENEELRNKWLSPETYQTLMDERTELLHELAALKQESAEPVAWECVNRVDKTIYLTRAPITSEWDDTLWQNTPLYTHPSTAAIEDFKRRAVARCKQHAADAWDHEGGALWCAEAIATLPLEEK